MSGSSMEYICPRSSMARIVPDPGDHCPGAPDRRPNPGHPASPLGPVQVHHVRSGG